MTRCNVDACAECGNDLEEDDVDDYQDLCARCHEEIAQDARDHVERYSRDRRYREAVRRAVDRILLFTRTSR